MRQILLSSVDTMEIVNLDEPGTSSQRAAEDAGRAALYDDLSGSRYLIFHWRLKRSYLIYSGICGGLSITLLLWNIGKGIENNWNLPEWQHYVWEEVLEILLCVLMISETAMTLKLVGRKEFFSNIWCMFDLAVSLLTAISMLYALSHLGADGEISQASLPLLVVRFVVQPCRVVSLLRNYRRARQEQASAQQTVDFSHNWEFINEFQREAREVAADYNRQLLVRQDSSTIVGLTAQPIEDGLPEITAQLSREVIDVDEIELSEDVNIRNKNAASKS